MKELKADAYLERLDQLQRKYTSIDYRLSPLLEQETKTPGTSLHELFTREQAAEFLGIWLREKKRPAFSIVVPGILTGLSKDIIWRGIIPNMLTM